MTGVRTRYVRYQISGTALVRRWKGIDFLLKSLYAMMTVFRWIQSPWNARLDKAMWTFHRKEVPEADSVYIFQHGNTIIFRQAIPGSLQLPLYIEFTNLGELLCQGSKPCDLMLRGKG
ncbi:hypothetical protein N7G274_002338 [Stereocaulon virgatum]|uniref:Uncharacterized protein n=1 Tax=Stereocaulon virgatum TaxID=373712 RepID=A0ABR4AJC9_9LECA